MNENNIFNQHETKLQSNLYSTFKNYQKKGHRNSIINSIMKKESKLPDLSSLISSNNIVKRNFDFASPVNISSIIGSQNKIEEFDNNFFPTKKSQPQKWMRSANSILSNSEVIVKLIKYGNNYFVKDGLYFISAAKCLGIQNIDAEIEEYIPSSKIH